jgi:hypothetical protein
MTRGVTAQPLFDGTFSIDAVASAAHALVQQLHDQAMATIASLADSWDSPVEDVPAVADGEPVTYRDPATWSVDVDDEDQYADEDEDEDEEVRVLSLADLPPLLLRPRQLAAL